ncbi:MAG: DUF11 domain-containing protein [Gemmataceae bacterium]|nr:DUF11 domain-containing protein [Gemmataceae bacterium]
MRSYGLCLAIVLSMAEVALGQFPFQQVPAPPPPGPLMYVRFAGPKGAKITVYRGFDQGQTLELPCTLGFRPGYSYRLAVFDIPGLPRHVFCPSLEVRGTLALSGKTRNADFPAQINFNEEELGRAVLGSFIKKVVTLERPDQAIPVASKPDQPLEIPVQATRDPFVEAAERGAPLIVYHLGQRFLTPQELNALAIPGTVLLPGERVLGTPRLPPYLFWNWYPVFDPVHGPRPASEFNTVYDGGDSGAPAGFNRFGKLKGLDPTDTIAEYTDSRGNQKHAASNRVGVCVPRFVIIKAEYNLARQSMRTHLGAALTATSPSASVGQASAKEQSAQQHPESIGTKLRLSGTFNTLGTSAMGRVQGLEIKSILHGVGSVDVIANGPKQTEPADGPLMIIKWPDKTFANVGEVVTFYLKYSNTGGQPITSVVVSDSLAARFEYVKGSTKTDRDALFTTQLNEAGSTLLRWEFGAALQPREHGLITFQVRVR